MIKQPSQANVKSKAKDRSKSKPTNSRSKMESHPNKTIPLERNINNDFKAKQNAIKDGKKLRIEQFRPQTTASKLKNQSKQQTDNYGLHMKAQLKHLINKNRPAKSKNIDVVPQLLKNIEKNCKALKNIHQKQCQIQSKRSSQHSNKAQTVKRSSIQLKKNDQRSKQKQCLQKDLNKNEVFPPKITRFSLQISQGEAEKVQIQQKLRQVQIRKSAENNENHKNFVELFKLYKKSFEIEQFKIEKSNRKTNYNTNQSRNSSSHHNSHGHSRAGDYLRGKSKEQEKLNIQKIQHLIKSQQQKVEKQNVDNNQPQIYTGRENIQISRGQELFKKNISFINEVKINQYLKQEKIINFSENFVVNNTDNACFRLNQASNDGINNQKSQKHQRRQLQSQLQVKSMEPVKEAEFQKQNEQVTEKKFQKSKFYVLPIPKFESKKKEEKEEEEEDLSLLGCEITLIQNNILMEDSELVSLQL